MAFEGIDKNDNHTRYNTEDLNDLLSFLDGTEFISSNSYTGGYQGGSRRRARVDLSSVTNVRPLYGDVPTGRRGYSWRQKSQLYPPSDVAYRGEEQLRLRTPKALVDWYKFGMIAAAGSDNPTVPTEFVKEIAKCVVVWQFANPDSFHEDIEQAVAEAVRLHSIRIMPNIESPVESRRPLTPEERLARLRSDSFYGAGGVLEGPDWAWRSGHRCPTEKWAHRIEESQVYYERELDARNKYIRQIEELGGEVKPYETFAEYLRQKADEIEAAGAATWRSFKERQR